MKINALASSVVVIILMVILGYGVFKTFGSKDEVTAKLAELTPADEKEPIDVNILSHKTIQRLNEFKAFGPHPINVDTKSLNVPDPFSNL
jgi:hypothetical protein